MQQDRVILTINLTDLSTLGTIGALGSPLNLMLRADLGDELLPGAYFKLGGNLDTGIILVRTTTERAQALQAGLVVIGQRKLGRKVRTKVRQRLPNTGKGWRYTAGL